MGLSRDVDRTRLICIVCPLEGVKDDFLKKYFHKYLQNGFSSGCKIFTTYTPWEETFTKYDIFLYSAPFDLEK